MSVEKASGQIGHLIRRSGVLPNHDHWAGCLTDATEAHRTEERAGQRPTTPSTDHQEVSSLCLLEEDLCRMALSHFLLEVDLRIAIEIRPNHPPQVSARALQAVLRAFMGDPHVGRRVFDDHERPNASIRDLRLGDRPRQRRLGLGRTIDTDENLLHIVRLPIGSPRT